MDQWDHTKKTTYFSQGFHVRGRAPGGMVRPIVTRMVGTDIAKARRMPDVRVRDH